ncbi:hypothetical protein I6A60_34100 [Frankia sp. AgB1.9]|uniref:nSTAND1 domain-containing NTPase n=1 Tax=unclassified Frankia TaxID=2632575 RepID=UPI00193327D7|nr:MULTISPECIES: hypothetical protein [unclassified Frankia]MBL7488138.1 hypothetical protein [Frankia sp. AgW1.1]MBL7552850.1 hypothetical protein [Frankia sp. AgB1.9]MBL7620141.1 hypothetical protein [Frankia sp. AgB1.8]
MDYDLTGLGSREFEHLAQALLTAVFKQSAQVFGDGPDQGRDGTFDGVVHLPAEAGGGSWAGYGVMQAKFQYRPDGDVRWFVRQVEKELGKWRANARLPRKDGSPEYLLFVTNVVLSPARNGGVDAVNSAIARYSPDMVLKGWRVWHYDTLCRLLDVYGDVRRAYAHLILPGDVLSAMHDRLITDLTPSHGTAKEGRPACPYKGLAAFTAADEDVFFGREQLTARLVGRLARSAGDRMPLVVIGGSGAGKSSLLAAGLLPAVRRGRLDIVGSADWPTVYFTPTSDPLGALAAALAEMFGESGKDIEEDARSLRDNPGNASRWFQDKGDGFVSGGRALLIVDQFEEAFVACQDDAARRAFAEALCAIAVAGSAVVVISVRSDFAAGLDAIPRLREALEAGPVLVGPMSQHELRAAIEQPARAAGLDLEQGLVDAVLRDVDDRPANGLGADSPDVGRLPLVSHALLATWQKSSGRRLTLAGYHATGGIGRAVANTAEMVLSRFDDREHDLARSLLLVLVRIGDGADDTRRRQRLSELLANTTDPDRMRHVLAALAAPDARLITIDEDHVAITHEALLRAWPTLRDWIEGDRAGQVVRQRIEDDASIWSDADRDSDHLYRGNRLSAGLAWADEAGHRAALSLRARGFLAAGRRRARRRLTGVIAGLVTVLLLVSALGIAAYIQSRAATKQSRIAGERLRATIGGQLLTLADNARADDSLIALRLGLAAYDVAPADLGAAARGSLLATLADNPALRAPIPAAAGQVNTLAFGPHNLLATGGRNGSTRLWDLADPDQPRLLGDPLASGPGIDAIVAFGPGGLLATAASRASVQLWDVSIPTKPRRLGRLASGEITAMAFSANGRLVTSYGGYDDEAAVWDVSDPRDPKPFGDLGDQIQWVGEPPASTIAFLSDNTVAAVSSLTVRLWDISDPAHPRQVGDSLGGRVATFGPGGLLALDDTLWDATDPAGARQIGALTTGPSSSLQVDTVTAAAFGPGALLATARSSGVLQVWDIVDPARPNLLRAMPTERSAEITTLMFGQDGLLAAGSADGTARIWDVSDSGPRQVGGPLGKSSNSVVAFSVGSRRLAASAGADGTHVWDISNAASPRQVNGIDGRGAAAVAADPRGLIAVGGDDGVLRLWDLSNPRSPRPLGRSSSPVSPFKTAMYGPGGLLATTDQDNAVRLWDTSDPDNPHQVGRPLDGGGDPFSPPEFGPDHLLAAANITGTVQLWNIADPASPRKVGGPIAKDRAIAVAFGPGHLLAIGRNDGTIILWNVSDPAAPRQLGNPLTGQSGFVMSLAFDQDGLLVSAGTDDTTRLWDVSDPSRPHQLGAPLTDRDGGVLAVTFAPGGLLATNGGPDHVIHLWDVRQLQQVRADLIRTACARAGHGLSRQDWLRYLPDIPYQDPCLAHKP